MGEMRCPFSLVYSDSLKIVSLPFDQEGMDPEEFWGRLSKIEDGGGSPQFGMFATLCKACYLCLMQMLILRGYFLL